MDDLRMWVVDTSSLIEIRRSGMPRKKQAAVYAKLADLAAADLLVFPPQVREELERAEADHPDDPALGWIRKVRDSAEHAANLETVQRVLARAPLLVDAASPRDQADPYVIALALDAENLGGVSILSNDQKDKSDGRGGLQKLSIATVAGLWNIPVVPLTGFVLRFFDRL